MRSIAALMVARIALSAARGQGPDVGIDQHLNAQAPLELTFRDEAGQNVTLGKYFGARPVILVLGYYRCPRLCSMTLNNLAESLRKVNYEIGRDFCVVVVSIDPRESPQMAASKKEAIVAYFGQPGTAPGWHFLTGKEVASKGLAEAVGFRYAYDANHDLYAHASGVMVLTPEGKIARYFFGLEYAPRDLQFGLEDASAGTIGSPVARPLRMLCFAYDPDAGKYTLMSIRLVQLAGAFTVLCLGVYLIRAWVISRRMPSMVGDK